MRSCPQIERLFGRHSDMHVIVKIAFSEHERSGIAVLAVAQDRLQKGNLEALADVIDAEPLRWVLARVGEPAR